MTRAAVYLVIAASLWATNAAAGQTEPVRLELGAPVAREIAERDTHAYRVAVDTNEAVHLVARQLGADVVVTLLEADGTLIVEMDSPTGTAGAESIWFVAPDSGEFLVQVRTFEGYGGRYELELETLRDATPEDVERVRVQTLLLEAAPLAAQPTPEAQQAAISKLKEAAALAHGLGDPEAAALAVTALTDLDIGAGLESLGLPVLPGPIPTYYSPGYETRAAELRDDVVRGVDFFEQKLGVAPKIYLAVLDREHWSSVCFTGAPYGMPNSRGSRSRSGLVCLPTTHEMFDELVRNIKANMTEADLEAIESTGVPFEEAMRKRGDSIMYHELGHLYTGAYGIAVPNRWVNEFLANYLATAYESENPPDPQLRKFREIMGQASDRLPRPAHTSLEDFERLYTGMDFQNYVWYQRQLTRRAEEVYEAEGLDFLTQVKAAFPPGEPRPVPVQVSLERMESIVPGFLEWARQLAHGGS
jgi:hypothetical protein